MEKKHDSEIENLDNWDVASAEIRQPRKPSRVICSVAFKRDDFERLSKYTEQCGKKVSEFIREAALEKAFDKDKPILFSAVSGSLCAWRLDQSVNVTILDSSSVENPDDIIALTG